VPQQPSGRIPAQLRKFLSCKIFSKKSVARKRFCITGFCVSHSSQILSSRPVNRRGFLSLFGFAGTALALNPLTGLAVATTPANSVPADWMKALGARATDYVAFLDKLKLRFLPTAKIIEPHLKQHGSVRNSLPPAELWSNMPSTLIVADKIAECLGENIVEVISAYRSPAYNATCPGGKTQSQHLRNGALDLVFRSSPAKVAKVARELRSQGVFRGGVGLYPNFTHVDTRGNNADW
jgi:hypothetical protein